MAKLEELLKRRQNLAAKFELEFLTDEQLEELWADIKELPEHEREDKRRAFIADRHWLKLTVTRVADTELQRAEELARKRLVVESETKVVDYVEARRDHLWPFLKRHIVKGVELADGKWVEVEPSSLSQYMDLIGLAERSFLVGRYISAVAEDKKAAEADPSFLEGVSPRP